MQRLILWSNYIEQNYNTKSNIALIGLIFFKVTKLHATNDTLEIYERTNRQTGRHKISEKIAQRVIEIAKNV